MSIKESVKTYQELEDMDLVLWGNWSVNHSNQNKAKIDEFEKSKWLPLEVLKERIEKLREVIHSIPPEKLTLEITVIALRIDLVFGDIFQFPPIEKEAER